MRDGSRIQINRQLNAVSREFTHPKGKKSRFVPCNPTLLMEMKALLKQNKVGLDETFFQTVTGTPVAQNNFERRMFRGDIKKSSVKKIRFHDLRHTAATLMLGSGVDLRVVQEILGHKHISTTMNYAHLLGDAIKKASMLYELSPNNVVDHSKACLKSLGDGDPTSLKDHKLSGKLTKLKLVK